LNFGFEVIKFDNFFGFDFFEFFEFVVDYFGGLNEFFFVFFLLLFAFEFFDGELMDLIFERGDFRGELGVIDRLVGSWLLVLMADIVGERLGPLEECGVRSELCGMFCS
jgi:hypothetical protein